MNEYNEVPHTKIPINPMNEELRKMIEYGHKKEKDTAERIIDPITKLCLVSHLSPLIDILATTTDGELSHVLNYIVREIKRKKSNQDFRIVVIKAKNGNT